jgi:hypothetical protein
MQGGIFISVADIQKLLGCESYKTANTLHLSVRDGLGKKSKYLTIKEFCKYEELEFDYVWETLRGTPLSSKSK